MYPNHDDVLDTVKQQLLPHLQRPEPVPGHEIVPGLVQVALVLQTAGGDIPVTQEDLDRWEIGFPEAYRLALENLRLRSQPARWEAVQTVPGMLMYLPGNGDAAARALLLDELLERFPPEGVLFAMPTAEQLLVVPLEDFQKLPSIRVLVTAARLASDNATRPLSDQVFWSDGERITHIRVIHDGENVDILAPPTFLAAVERLASMTLVSAVGEA